MRRAVGREKSSLSISLSASAPAFSCSASFASCLSASSGTGMGSGRDGVDWSGIANGDGKVDLRPPLDLRCSGSGAYGRSRGCSGVGWGGMPCSGVVLMGMRWGGVERAPRWIEVEWSGIAWHGLGRGE